jgi:hypothetical protein
MRFWTIWRGRARRESDVEQRPLAAAAVEDEAEALDSSHIGFAPLISPLEPPHDLGTAGDAEQN